jgi:hypothetical protein
MTRFERRVTVGPSLWLCLYPQAKERRRLECFFSLSPFYGFHSAWNERQRKSAGRQFVERLNNSLEVNATDSHEAPRHFIYVDTTTTRGVTS